MSDLIEIFKSKSKALKEASDTKVRKDAHEKSYNKAYVDMVSAGLAPKLKGKYNY